MSNARRLAFVATILALSAACESRLTGNEGNFEFSYVTDDRPLDFNKPIAVGAMLDLQVRDVGARRPVEVSAASFDDDSVLDVVDFEDNVVTVESLADGNALLTVQGTTNDGEDLSDSVNLLARTPEVHKIWHTCAVEAASAHYLVDQPVWVPFDFEMENGQPVIGYGYYPVVVSDTGVLVLDEANSNATFMRFDSTTTAGSVTLTSDVDGTVRTLEVVEAGAIDGVTDPIAFVLEDIDVGDTNAFYVLPSVGGSPVCQSTADFEVTSDTPSTCTVAKRDEAPAGTADENRYEYGWFDVTGVAEGTCTYTVTYPDGNSGSGASDQFSYEIQP